MMITGRGFPRPSLWFMGGFGLWVVCVLCVGCGCGVPGCVGPCGFGCCLRRIVCLVVFVLVGCAILYPYFCGIVYVLPCFTLMLLINCFYYEWLSFVCRFFVD